MLALLLGACEAETQDEVTEEAPGEDAEEPEGPEEAEEPEEDPVAADAEGEPIRIGLLAPLTGAIAFGGQDSLNGLELFWEEHGYEAGGRPVEIIEADTGCDPDNAITQARRLVSQEDVHFIIGPLCGSEAAPVEQVSADTGVPVLVSIAGGDEVTQPSEVDTVVRTGGTSSQGGHPFGEWLYEQGCRSVTAFGTDYTHGHEILLGALETYQEAGGEVLDVSWPSFGTTDFGPVLGGVSGETDCVVPVVAGTEQVRLAEQWFDFGFDEQFEVYSPFWLAADTLPEMDDRVVGIVGNANFWAEGLETPEAQEFVDAFAEAYDYAPAIYAEYTYSTALWAKTAIDEIDGDVEDTETFLDAVRQAEIQAPRGPLVMDEYDNPVQNVYITEIQMVDHPVLGEVKMNVPIETYENVSQFWQWDPAEYIERGGYTP